MSLGLAFWLFFLLWIVFGVWSNYPYNETAARKNAVGFLFLVVLFFLLGWAAFGFIIQR